MVTPVTDAMIAQARAEHPTLMPVDPKGWAGANQALINVRQDLKEHFPTVSFRVHLQIRRGGASVLRLRWTEWPGSTPSQEDIADYVRNRWVGFTSAAMPFEERQRRDRFRAVFGGVERLALDPVPPTPEQWVRHERRVLRATMNDQPVDPAANAAPATRAPRQRL